ncbi:MAG: hypothetical protein JRI23_20040 [Deltaproteobacteria bacterium]|jgi:hypothetical protein|nr:hypothetical protein [Deltaproteobacteria bacterium]MBW2534166.1 hypothetical protein [Deltaproteobacteria bacterium]
MKGRRSRQLVTAVAVLLLAACSSDEEEEPVEALITLVNGSDMPVWVQTGTASWQPEWGVISDAAGPLRTALGCDCDCETGSCGTDCPTAPAPVADMLDPQEYVERTWTGSYYVESAAGDCVETHQAKVGETYSIEFCWGGSYALDGAGPNSMITNTECVQRDFTASQSQTLRHAALSAPVSETVTFVIENGGSAPIYVQEQQDCGTDPAWFSVSFGDEPLSLFEDCGLCPCLDVNCGEACPASCALASTVELAPGETIEHEWDGYHFMARSSPDCEQEAAAPRAPLAVELCWGTSVTTSQSEEQVDSPVCTSQAFRLGEDSEVRLVATP